MFDCIIKSSNKKVKEMVRSLLQYFFDNNLLKMKGRKGKQNVYSEDLNFSFNKLYLHSSFKVNLLKKLTFYEKKYHQRWLLIIIVVVIDLVDVDCVGEWWVLQSILHSKQAAMLFNPPTRSSASSFACA